tara:strand:- start:383 stop:979 length:597 start_codon:yes stop_codon:yes gene_type:complete
MTNTNPRFVSPTGVAVYPYLHKPDTKFNSDGEYKTTLRINKDDAKEIITKIDEGIKSSASKVKQKGNGSVKTANPPYKTDENGDYLVNFKLKAKVTNSKTGNTWTQKPAVFDATGKPMKADTIIWGGSEMKISYELIPYHTSMIGAGVTLRLKAAQILKLVSGDGAAASSFGFEKEDGFKEQEDNLSTDNEEEDQKDF